MADSTAHDESQVLTDIPRITPAPVYEPEVVAPTRARPSGVTRVHVVLFLLTLLTTTMAGADMAGAYVSLAHPFATFGNLAAGLSFSIPLMMILFAHEMGHYLVARRNSVDVSPPYFIPAPLPSVFFIGTFGAFIRMRSLPRSRRVMFDIGAAGPWAGVVLAVLAVAIGLELSDVSAARHVRRADLQLGNSILFWALSTWMLRVDPNTVSVDLHPIAFAGWLGLFVTALNLLPVGQLDGGHVIYALFGRRHRTISRLFIVACVLMVVVPLLMGSAYWGGWLFWVVLLFFLRPRASGDRRCGYAARSAAAGVCVGDDRAVHRDLQSGAVHGTPTGIRTRRSSRRTKLYSVVYQVQRAPRLPASRCGSKDSEMSGGAKRPSWDQYFMTITQQVAERSTCLRAKVGAVIVRDRSILATGYNGSPAGMPHCLDVGCLIYESRNPDGEIEQNCYRTIHAEINAITQAAQNGARDSRRRHLRDPHALHPMHEGAHQHRHPHRLLWARVQAAYRWRSAQACGGEAGAGGAGGRGCPHMRVARGHAGGPTARPCGICALIERCRAGAFADFVIELPHSFVILGDAQFYRGYCVVLARSHVDEIHLLPSAEARALFDETVAVGRAIALATSAAQAQLRMSRQSRTARPLARLSALRVGPDARGAGMDAARAGTQSDT